MKNEIIEAIVGELGAVGITPDIIHGGKHLKVRWLDRTYTAPKTPSDHRAGLNARAAVRRMIQEDGLTAINKKATPDDGNRDLIKRIERLQHTVDALSELMLELGAKLTPKATEEIKSPKIISSSRSVKLAEEQQLLTLIPEQDWIPASRLYLATTVPKPYLVIARLKRRGLVERRGSTQASFWRRVNAKQ
jgi:hypothetical protein